MAIFMVVVLTGVIMKYVFEPKSYTDFLETLYNEYQIDGKSIDFNAFLVLDDWLPLTGVETAAETLVEALKDGVSLVKHFVVGKPNNTLLETIESYALPNGDGLILKDKLLDEFKKFVEDLLTEAKSNLDDLNTTQEEFNWEEEEYSIWIDSFKNGYMAFNVKEGWRNG